MAAESKDVTMEYNFVGKSGLRVSNLCLGCMTFGENAFGFPGQSNEDLSHQILNRYVEKGGNFLDTADIYGDSEDIVGSWLATKERSNIVLATKCRYPNGNSDPINGVGLTRRHIMASIDRSLKRLQTDYVDIFQAHYWDDATPIEETLRALDDLVRCGKIRYVGYSNVTGWQLQKLVCTTEKLGLSPIISLQQQYNLVRRDSELEPFQVCKLEGIGVFPWSPLKGGLLTGKVKRDKKPTEGRLGWIVENENDPNHVASLLKTATSDSTFDTIEKAEEIGKRHGRSTSQVAIRWLLQKDVVTSVIIGARTLAQLDDNMGAATGWSLSKEEMQELDELSKPALPYPYDLVFHLNKERQNPNTLNQYVESK